ncbi:DUF4381 domain-containing protein [Legionella clemsonensis]|uniref:DUF4381 domain-containing protein n=1 Tax=Legionella clemsonensis TaxID=1867846 RepID=A0A222NYP7_9GAMM|nr:DUF4381 domain-containing protein [Legionella clemsonensis]ASQ44706.1 hypothetical protein clem_00700 [Legionella clemsonensis]
MADAEVLNQLRDIQLPQPVGWWPLAPGWYFLIALGFLFVGLLLFLGYRRYQRDRAKKEALSLLAAMQKEYQQGADSQITSMKISELLRRVALVYYPREEVAGLQGQHWLDFLNRTARGIDFNKVSYHLLQLPYQKTTGVNLDPLFHCTKMWIKQRGVPCSN